MAEAPSNPVPDGPGLGAFLLLWLSVPLVELYLGWPLSNRPMAWQYMVEFAVFAGLGWAQWRFATHPVLRTPFGPLLVSVGMVFLVMGPDDLVGRLLYLVGIGVVVWAGLTALARFRIPLLVGALVAVGARVGEQVVRMSTIDSFLTLEGGAPFADVALWPLRAAPVLPPAVDVGPPVVIISIDTLRADDAAAMTSLRRLAARGASWPRAMSTSSWTLPAVASIQTGLSPQDHGAACLAGVHCQGMVEGVPLLAEDLAEKGYANAAFLANAWLSRTTGFAPGFHNFQPMATAPFDLKLDMVPPKDEELPSADQVVDAALSWLEATPNPSFYLWVHLLDPHMPYVNAEDEAHREVLGHDLRVARPWTPDMQAALRESYRNEIAVTDAALGRLLDALEARGVLDSGIVVLTADHGEEFWEHGDVEHGHSHHAEVVDVPLVLVAPGVEPGERVGLASLMDIAPTVRAAVGLGASGYDLRQPIPADRIAVSWGTIYRRVQCSARDATRRLILDECNPAYARLYDLVHDPMELHGVAPVTGDPLLVAVEALEPPLQHGDEAATTAALEALGYVDR